jgi:hypothetical protein
MERRNPHYRFAVLSLFVAFAAACGDQSANHSATQAGQSSEVAQCSLAMPANSTAVQVQRTVAEVLAGRLDPCSGAVDLKGTSAELLRIDADDDLSIRIFFRIFRGNQQLP